ncbi:MAG: hypothetical protein U5J63_01855 [Fodinibius sp.]|nr:hypothetical protein [Fodinibius sp.]
MKISIIHKTSKHALSTMILAVSILLGACSETPGDLQAGDDNIQFINNKAGASLNSQAAIDLEVTSAHNHTNNEHLFELSTKTIGAGWSTIKFNNASHSDHFLLVYKVPQEALDAADTANEPILQHWYNGVTVPFQEEFNPYIKGDISYGEFVNNLIGTISTTAPWFLDPGAVTMGGPGITSSGESSITTVKLEPGTYVVECYVKDENQEFHSYNGMLDILEVKAANTDEDEPKATMKVSITQNGLDIPQNIRPGLHTVENILRGAARIWIRTFAWS